MEDHRLEQLGALALNTIFGYDPKISRSIIDNLGSAHAVFNLSEERRLELFGPFRNGVDAINDGALEKAEKELDRLEAEGLRFLPSTDPAFPQALLECPDAPAGLYIRSDSGFDEIFDSRPYISVVGTRDISLYGKEWCTRIVRALAEAPCKPVIVSGLAIGVDITAHMAALAGGIPTIAVLPTGIDDVYPVRHRAAAAKIAEAPGSALITDYPPCTEPAPYNFLRRNRIIAGLGQATILVESKAQGGGTMTARLAAGYGRDVFCVPGRLDDLRSEGCNRLIREKIAEPVGQLSELCDALGLGHWHRRRKADFLEEVGRFYDGKLSIREKEAVLGAAELIRKHRGVSVDELGVLMKTGFSEASAAAGMLESDGFISRDLLGRCAINVKND